VYVYMCVCVCACVCVHVCVCVCVSEGVGMSKNSFKRVINGDQTLPLPITLTSPISDVIS